MESVCDHCLTRIGEKDAVFDEIDDVRRAFCCAGCQGIFHLLRNSGLDGFYKNRTQWISGPPRNPVISASDFKDSITEADGESSIDLAVSGIRCTSCVWLIEHFLMKSVGIKYARVNYAAYKAQITWDPRIIGLSDILKRIASIGYKPLPYSASSRNELKKKEKRDLIIRLGAAFLLSMQGMMLSIGLYAGYFQGISRESKEMLQMITWILATPVIFYSGYPFIKNSILGLGNRVANMDTLVFIGSFSAYVYSIFMIERGGEVYFDTSSMIITLVLVGRVIENEMRGKASEAVSSLIDLQPKEARLIGGMDRRLVPISAVKAGDAIEVIPGEAISFDGMVDEGESEVDESMLTGESLPVKKEKGSEVFAGTMNLNGRLILSVRSVGGETVLSRIIRAVEDGLAHKARFQQVAERVVRLFVPAVLFVSFLTFVIWYAGDAGPDNALMISISVLVISCPCALGLATTLAVLTGSTALMRKGVLIKSGDVVEAVSGVDAVVFDKTGTLTTGKPSLVDICAYGADKEEVCRLAASLEAGSEHAIAKTLVRGRSDGYAVGQFRAHPGNGVEGTVMGKRHFVGNIGFLRHCGMPITDEQMEDSRSLNSNGNTVIGIGTEEQLMGWLAFSDAIRPETRDAIKDLKRLGLKIKMLTGDNRTSAEKIAAEAGISRSDVESEITPLQKSQKISELKKAGFKVLMVGDGINDATALVEADAGVAMGRGTDIAIKSSGIVLMRNDLTLIPSLIKDSRKTISVVKQNLFWAFSYNLIAIPLAVTGNIHPIASAAFMAVSSIVVTVNSLRLRSNR